jgi:hypothetical protein
MKPISECRYDERLKTKPEGSTRRPGFTSAVLADPHWPLSPPKKRDSGRLQPVCERRVNLLFFSLSLHRHSYIGFILAFASSIHNKQLSQSWSCCLL